MLNNLMYINRFLLAQMRRIYFMALPETKQDLKKSRVYFTISDSAAQTIVQLVGGTFLATLMAYCGISDANIGIITSLVSLAAMIWLTIVSSVSGVFGFLISILGGVILNHLQRYSLHIGGITIYSQQVLNLFGFLVILIAVAYIKLSIETEKIGKNHKDGRVKI